MNILILLVVCFVPALAAPQTKNLPSCDPKKCVLPDCKCSEISKNNDGRSPQFVVLSFDDALPNEVYDEFIRPMFINRKNPDKCPISGTFFVPHEYTNYSIVNTLYRRGYEIASHSITKHFLQEYWRNATVAELQAEFHGQRQILNKFAKIPESDIVGVRVPQLQLNAYTFQALRGAGFNYDSSWPTLQSQPMAPYTLDYKSVQTCHTVHCQETIAPGLWEMPIVDWIDQNGVNCNSVDACAVLGDDEVIFQWMKDNFIAINRTGAPISFRINYSWFLAEEQHKGALVKFLDYVGTLSNTFIVSHRQVLEWSKNPTDSFTSCQSPRKAPCKPITCIYEINGNLRPITVCDTCPMNYPWIDNPLGL